MSPQATSGFSPLAHGFGFVNHFTNDLVPALDIRTSGLCGGMSYAALDYYFAGMPVPSQRFQPANGTPLHSYLYDRQVNAIVNDLVKWAELGFNPFGIRDREFFNWGLTGDGSGRIDELRSILDEGRPAIIGLQGDGGTGNHYVIAIGYDMGRYKGDLGEFQEDFKIRVCDPNFPKEVRTLVPDVARAVYRHAEGGSNCWRAYFVGTSYEAHEPPALGGAGPGVHGLVLMFSTGDDDLRGGNDNVDLVANLVDGTQLVHRNINLGARWVVNNTEYADVTFDRPIQESQLDNLVISTTFGGGSSGDNWDMTRLEVYVVAADGTLRRIKSVGGKRFSGDDGTLVVPIRAVAAAAGQVNQLAFTFVTGGDDLRGGNDNLDITIHFRDGSTQQVPNANGALRWHDNTTNKVTVELGRAVAPADIVQIDLHTTFRGGAFGDNWDMASMTVHATGNGVHHALASAAAKRFTGDDGTLVVPVDATPPAAGQADNLIFTVTTGGDDLRGGNDNVSFTIHFRDGSVQRVGNANGGLRWADNTVHDVPVALNRPVRPADITQIDLDTAFTGGAFGDNWNMDALSVRATGTGVDRQLLTYGAKRFTGDDGALSIPIA